MRICHSYTDLQGGRWVRGNLHAHTTRSDGVGTPQEVIDGYAGRGYGFLMISDHDRPMFAGELAALDGRGMVLIPGNEITAHGEHMLHVHANSEVAPDADRQNVINAINIDPSSFAIINHPNWFPEFNHCSQEKLEAWQGYLGIELYNGTVEFLEGSALAVDRWDRLLSRGRRVWGFANDDSHSPSQLGLGWNVAYVTEMTPTGIVEALRAGRFYASTGVTIREIHVDGDRLHLVAPEADRIIMIGKHQRRLAEVDGGELSLSYPEAEPYVRFECLGRGGRTAWTQPFFVTGGE